MGINLKPVLPVLFWINKYFFTIKEINMINITRGVKMMLKKFFQRFFNKKQIVEKEKTDEEKKEELSKLKAEVRQYLKEQGYKGKLTIISSSEKSRTQSNRTANESKVMNKEVEKESSKEKNEYDTVRQMNDFLLYQDNDNNHFNE